MQVGRFAIAALLLVLPASAQEDKRRIEELEKKVAELSQRVKDLEDYVAQLKAMTTKAMAVGAVASNERQASFSLKTLATAEADFRANDRDLNNVNDFWVGDVSGLYRYRVDGREIKLIERALAAADASPLKIRELSAHEAERPIPKGGYLYTVLAKAVEDGRVVKYHAGDFRNSSRFGFAAYPAEYPAAGRSTFIINENYTVWKKDLGGKIPEVFPDDPGKDGWQKVD